MSSGNINVWFHEHNVYNLVFSAQRTLTLMPRFIIDSFCILISIFFLYKSLITLLGFLGWERGSTEVQKYSPRQGQASETERVSAFFRALS